MKRTGVEIRIGLGSCGVASGAMPVRSSGSAKRGVPAASLRTPLAISRLRSFRRD